jgi:hypothetical protein
MGLRHTESFKFSTISPHSVSGWPIAMRSAGEREPGGAERHLPAIAAEQPLPAQGPSVLLALLVLVLVLVLALAGRPQKRAPCCP